MSTSIRLGRDTELSKDEEPGLPSQHTFATLLPRWWYIARLWLTGKSKASSIIHLFEKERNDASLIAFSPRRSY